MVPSNLVSSGGAQDTGKTTFKIFLCEFGMKPHIHLTEIINLITYLITQSRSTPTNSEIICGRNVSTKVVCGIILFFKKKAMLKI